MTALGTWSWIQDFSSLTFDHLFDWEKIPVSGITDCKELIMPSSVLEIMTYSRELGPIGSDYNMD